MIVLVINTNRTFLKYQLIRPETGTVLAKGQCDRIGLGKSSITHYHCGRSGEGPSTQAASLPDIKTAVKTTTSTPPMAAA